MFDLKHLKRKIAPYYRNLRGWCTNKKIIVIESDDWGSIRMPSREVYKRCLEAGYRVDLNPYEKYDSLASEEDLEYLFELLTSFKDQHGHHPVITANVLTANPDFKKIVESEFTQYHYESIKKTMERYPKHAGAFNMWIKGMNNRVFFPQSHGREHLNVSLFMEALQKGDQDAKFGFNHEMPGCVPNGKKEAKNPYVVALKYKNESDKEDKLKLVLDGLRQFKDLFGFKSKSFIAPNYWWSPDFDGPISEFGVHYYQGNRVMKEPLLNAGYHLHRYKLGDVNEFGQLYLVRNASFEPSLFRLNVSDPVSNCLREISIAFLMQKPAIISSHRINYVGYIDEKNRDVNLKYLNTLLDTILKKWPDVEFMTSDQLGDHIENDVA